MSKKEIPVAAIAGGNFLELYDFTIYGYFAPVIARLFFPAESQMVSMLATFSAFALGFFIRPLGAVVFGHIGDVLGRRPALILSLGLMGLSSLIIAVMPNYQQIGILAPLALIVCRLLQGLSMSGEVAATLISLAERAKPQRQGLFSSLVHVSGISGMVIGSLTATLVHFALPEDAVESWGWRLAYFAGALGCIVLAWIRIKWCFSEVRRAPVKPPISLVCREHKMAMVRVGVLNILNGTCFFMVFVYINTYWSEQLFYDRAFALAINSCNMLLMVLMIPFAGLLSDRVGARIIMTRAVVAGIFMVMPSYWLMTGPELWKVVIGQFGFSLLLAFIYGSGAVLSARLLPSPVRMTGLALGYNTAQGFFGSLSPVIATWLVGVTGIATSPVLYLLAIYTFGLAMIWRLPVTVDRPLTA